MLNKKQMYNLIERTAKWNIDRGNTPQTLNKDLEYSMLLEELTEYKESTTTVDDLDACLDILFVTLGTLTKMNLTPSQITEAYEIVVTANESKSSTKDSNGKIVKDKSTFIEPEPLLQLILDKRL